VTLPPGAVHDIPAGYAGTPFMGMMGQIPGTIYARNYDNGGQGVGFNHPGGTTCGDWPAGMTMYRTGADCVGLSVENAQKPDVTVTGAPADYGEIYISYCAMGEWLKYTVEVAESGTYAVSLNEGGPNVSISLAFSATPAVTTGTLMIPQSVDQAQPGHEMYHVWQTVNDVGMVTLQAGIYVMQFTIVTSQANFDSFTFTKM
jgi:beta-glucosidase